MILPNLPSKFSSGETLTAAKLNAMIDWMRDIARLLPGLQVNTGRGLVYSRSSAGTTVSLAHGYIQGSDSGDEAIPHPFHVRVIYDDAEPTGVAVSGGGVFMSVIPSIHRYTDGDADVFTQNDSFVESYYQDGKTIAGNPAGKKLYWTYDRATGERTFELTAEESGNTPDAQNATIRVKIAEFEEADGITLVSQFLRSDIFVTRTDYSC